MFEWQTWLNLAKLYSYTARKYLDDFVIYNCDRWALVKISLIFRYIGARRQ
jgi:hypothetical protein